MIKKEKWSFLDYYVLVTVYYGMAAQLLTLGVGAGWLISKFLV